MTYINSWIVENGITFATGIIAGFILFLISHTVKDNHKKTSARDKVDGEEFEFKIAEIMGDCKMVLVVRNDLKMGKGKAAAQCSHAAVMAHEIATKKCPDMVRKWKTCGQRKVVVKTESEGELLDLVDSAKRAGLVYALVQDAGLTQVKSGTRTVMAVGPGPESLIDQITGHLKLY